MILGLSNAYEKYIIIIIYHQDILFIQMISQRKESGCVIMILSLSNAYIFGFHYGVGSKYVQGWVTLLILQVVRCVITLLLSKVLVFPYSRWLNDDYRTIVQLDFSSQFEFQTLDLCAIGIYVIMNDGSQCLLALQIYQ